MHIVPTGLFGVPESPKRAKKEVISCRVGKIPISRQQEGMTLLNLSTDDQMRQISQEGLAIDAASLYKALEKVKDTRGKKGKRYPLAFILTLVLLGKQVGQTKIAGIMYWINERKKS